MRWDQATAVITGASRGIGEAVAEAADKRGARVGMIARTAADLTAVQSRLHGQSATAVADVGDRKELASAIAELEGMLGPTDVLVANAGVGAYGPFADIDVDELEHLVQVNVLGSMYAVKAVLPSMIERRRGHIVVVSSIAGRIGSPFEAAYSATKFAQVGWAEAMAVELAPYGIGVTIVNPGVVATNFGEARGHPYDRSFPKPIPASRVAQTVIDAVEQNRAETFTPRWMGGAVVVRHLAPALNRWGTRRSFKSELDAMSRR